MEQTWAPWLQTLGKECAEKVWDPDHKHSIGYRIVGGAVLAGFGGLWGKWSNL